MTCTVDRPPVAADGLTLLLEAMAVEAYRLGSRKALAAHLGISQSMLSGMLKRRKPVPDAIARRFGFCRQVIYTRTDARPTP